MVNCLVLLLLAFNSASFIRLVHDEAHLNSTP